ncbi:MAG TPA: hypothetical protein PLC68_09020 [Caldisericia bacterium]|nr:hypothetical protein [Caldisericia bacterium]
MEIEKVIDDVIFRCRQLINESHRFQVLNLAPGLKQDLSDLMCQLNEMLIVKQEELDDVLDQISQFEVQKLKAQAAKEKTHEAKIDIEILQPERRRREREKRKIERMIDTVKTQFLAFNSAVNDMKEATKDSEFGG